MMQDREKRNSPNGIVRDRARSDRVGGRQGDRCPGPGGGGYLDICTKKRPPVEDPRLAELAACGLAAHWLRVAAEIGVDSWLRAWQILSEEDSVQDDCGRVHVPSISTYMRYQRNLLIDSMARRGATAEEVQRVLRDRLGYDLTLRYVRQLMRSASD